MSHFTVLVIGDNPEGQLAPYQENNMGTCPEKYMEDIDNGEGGTYRDNPNCKWDWYQLGGRWTGFFIKKDGGKGITGEPGVFGGEAKPGRIDQGIKGDIDFTAMFDEASDHASQQWEEVSQLFDGEMPQVEKTWMDIANAMDPFDRDKAKELYHAQPALVAYAKLKAKYPRATKEKPNGLTALQEKFLNGFHMGNPIDDFKTTRDEYVGMAMANAIATFAVLKDGKWYEKGQMGWWGMSSNDKDQKDWNTELHKLVTESSDDTLFSMYDCHI